MYLSGKLHAKKLNSLRILKNDKAASNFRFPHLKRLTFLTYQFTVHY